MAINSNLLIIDGYTVPKITDFRITRAKLWKEAERNMNGDVRATFIGVFPKIEVQVSYLTQSEMALLSSKLDKSYFSVSYYDSRSDSLLTAQYYASDFTTELDSKHKGRYKPFSFSLIPVSKRSY